MTSPALDRELATEASDPIGLDGIEFIEYTTPRPQALGQVLEMMGFRPIARHRSREVTLYRQGEMNIVVNASSPAPVDSEGELDEAPKIAAIALRVRDAAAAYRHVLDLGAWGVPTKVEVMELNIPAIHGVGGSRIYFVDRYREFSIYDVDFTAIPTVDQKPPALADMHWFGIVQYIGNDRMQDWTAFYSMLFGFAVLPDDQRFGVMPKGRVLVGPGSARSRFYVQLIEPEPGILDAKGTEWIARIGLGTPDPRACVAALRERGMAFAETPHVHSDERGALTRTQLGSVVFELVRDAAR
ncbi:4-hydroxyphenylpyruvate dioxygenase [Scleromatobacter humisilvae]|uniref:4-hydroxyphenylpyruvate dioxygenase n=1 Tax=Scleromatobacter humisilvae TaxID=2897159 RepID=A0A9X2C0L4_9BURK|nr:4-hydroxyphenylpyruvate dioxygenase [Scleromatobacter humisilvae]MCK9687918.1 4-hydroxyphenylpyruvate dioxygenase [Scleromatobacter humisilvae]